MGTVCEPCLFSVRLHIRSTEPLCVCVRLFIQPLCVCVCAIVFVCAWTENKIKVAVLVCYYMRLDILTLCGRTKKAQIL